MTSRGYLGWKVACGIIVAAVFAADVWVFWWLEAWNDTGPERVHDMRFLVLVLGGLFFPLSAGVLFWGFFNLLRARASIRWPVVQGRVLSKGVKEEQSQYRVGSSIQHRYFPMVSYEYDVGGQRYQSDVVQFNLSHVGSRDEAEWIVSAYQPGKPVRVHYDPDNPQDAVLNSTGYRALHAMALAAFGFTIPFLAALMYSILGKLL